MISLASILSILLGFLATGVVWGFIDEHLGFPIRRFWANMTTEHGLAEDDKKGFIVGQHFSRKWVLAGFISAAQMVWMMYTGKSHFLTEVTSIFFEVPVMVLGFYLVSPFRSFGKKFIHKVGPTLDSIERGETTIGGLAKGKFGDIDGAIRDRAENISERASGIVTSVRDNLSRDDDSVSEKKVEVEIEEDLLDPPRSMFDIIFKRNK